LIRASLPKATFLEADYVAETEFDDMMSEVGHKMNAMHDTDIDDRDEAWRKDRRRLLEQYYNIVRKHELDRDSRELASARAVSQVLPMTVSAKLPWWPISRPPLCIDFANRKTQRLRAKGMHRHRQRARSTMTAPMRST
jgi:hypothetical protein